MQHYSNTPELAVMVLASALLCSCSQISETDEANTQEKPPELCLFNGHIYESEGAYSKTGLTVVDGRIANLQSLEDSSDCTQYANAITEIIDLEGAFLFPGFVDSHAHLLEIGLREMTLNLEGVASIVAVQEKLALERDKTPVGETIYGRGWIETHWPEGRFLSKHDLDAIAPDHPVLLQRWGGHAMAANSMALEHAGITKDTPAPFGGDILLGDDGEPSGMLIDNAQKLVDDLLPKLTLARREAAFVKASELYAAAGWTGIQSMSVAATDVAMIERLSDEGRLKLRVYSAVDFAGAESLLDEIANSGPRQNRNKHVTTRTIKLYSDGALGSRGAALLAPYDDRPDSDGLMLIEEETIMPILERALRDGFQMSTHAIGDRANRKTLEWYEKAFERVPEAERKIAHPRWRIEHAQILNVDDIQRFNDLGVIASMQPSHAILDLHFAVDRLGVERLEGGYAWRSLIDDGALIAAGSDAPFNGAGEPRIELYAAIARKDTDGFSAEGWYPDEKVTRSEAIKMLTQWSAFAAFEDEHAGVIEIGKNADFTAFDKDILSIPEADILGVRTLLTIVDGEVIYKN